MPAHWVYVIIAIAALALLLNYGYYWAWTRGWNEREQRARREHDLLMQKAVEVIHLKAALFKAQKAAGSRPPNESEH